MLLLFSFLIFQNDFDESRFFCPFVFGSSFWFLAAPPNNCPRPELNHGYFVAEDTTSAFPDKLFYACEPGFKPSVGWGVITCTGGEWSSKPNCIRKSCSPVSCLTCLVSWPPVLHAYWDVNLGALRQAKRKCLRWQIICTPVKSEIHIPALISVAPALL